MIRSVTVFVPTLDGGEQLLELVDAVFAQETQLDFELLLVDSSSTDGAPEEAASRGARLHRIRREEFGHGKTRNLAVTLSDSDVIAFLSQDAVPASRRWLDELAAPLQDIADVVATYGRQLPFDSTPAATALSLNRFFENLSPLGAIRVQRLTEDGRSARSLIRETYFSNVNSAVLRETLSQVRFAEITWAEDRRLAWDLLHAGYAVAYVPQAAVRHAHDLSVRDTFRRALSDTVGLRLALPLAPSTAGMAASHLLSGVSIIAAAVRGDLAFLTALRHLPKTGVCILAELFGAVTARSRRRRSVPPRTVPTR